MLNDNIQTPSTNTFFDVVIGWTATDNLCHYPHIKRLLISFQAYSGLKGEEVEVMDGFVELELSSRAASRVQMKSGLR